jgi:hypothetical protein
MVNILKNNIYGTLKELFSQIFPLQMSVQRKKTEVSIMFLKGDGQILFPALIGYTYRAD